MSEFMSYIACCPKCKAIVMACVDDPKHAKDTAKAVAESIRDGDIIERVTCEYVRANWSACKCNEPEAQQLTLDVSKT